MEILKQFIENRHETVEVAIHVNYGGFGLTKEMCEELKLDYKKAEDAYLFNEDRTNPILIDLIKKLKPENFEIVTLELEDVPRAYLRNHAGNEKIIYNQDDLSRPLMDYLYKRQEF